MFFFLSLRESPTQPGQIEPDISIPTTTSTSTSTSTKISTATSSYREYVTRWDLSNKPNLARKLICFLILGLHLPLNLISILSHRIGLGLIFGIIWSVLNFVCLAYALYRIDVMVGQRLVCGKMYSRHDFDYVLLGLMVFYSVAFGLLFARMPLMSWRILWACVVAADVVCFLTGWFATWRDVGALALG